MTSSLCDVISVSFVTPLHLTNQRDCKSSKQEVTDTHCETSHVRIKYPPPQPTTSASFHFPPYMRKKRSNFYDSISSAAIKRVRGELTASPYILQCLIEMTHDTRECRLERQVERKKMSATQRRKTVNLPSRTETFVSKAPQFVFSFGLDQCRVFTCVAD